MPAAAAWLGGLGVVPFVLAAAAIWLMPSSASVVAGPVIVVYAAIILSFLGGLTWGVVCAAATARQAWTGWDSRMLAFSVIPALVAWAAVFLPLPYPFMAMTLGFLGVLLIDRSLAIAGVVPPWWMTLRVRLSLSVAALLLVAAAGL